MKSNKQGKQVVLSDGKGGRGSARENALASAVPDDDDLNSAGEMSGVEGSPKRAREHHRPEPSKRRGTGAGGDGERPPAPVLDLDHMERLLGQHAERIMKAQKENLDGMLALFEQQTQDKINRVDQKTDAVDRRVQSLEEKMGQMQDQLTRALGSDRARGSGEAERRLTLVFGGWDRDSRKPVILQQLHEALEQLGLSGHLDSEPFCTGPRRSTAMSIFKIRENETEHLTRKRMHDIITSLATARVPIPPTGRKMFATYSKSRAERAVSNHAGWIKRAMGAIGQGVVDQLDVEYNTGTCWMGDSMVASASRPCPPGLAEAGLMRDEVEGNKTWIDLTAIARESRTPYQEIAKALEEARR